RAELAPYNISVTTVIPGLMRTGSPRNALFKGKNEAEYAWFKVGDSLPLLSISAESAAKQILDGCRNGSAEVILSLPAELAVRFHGIFPGLTADILSLMDRLLPEPGGIGTEAVRGKESETAVTESFLTTLTQQAAERNNQTV
ncbi:MAG: ketoacyl reductase, partial [Armatimonadetes bacterium]|nr:ketoacyl reductase [Armatimonadota bacterium]